MVQEMIEVQAGLPMDGTSEPAGVALEAALARLDERLAVAHKALSATQRQLKNVTEASRQGNLRDLARLLDGAAEASATLASVALEARRSWTFDGHGHLESGEYMAELLDCARAGGLDGAARSTVSCSASRSWSRSTRATCR